MNSFEKIKGNFGFGCMRLPMNGKEVNISEFKKMVDYFIDTGFNYFDTAHGYLDGKSETALREALTDRYNREDYILVNKLSGPFFNKNEDILPYFNKQLEACGVDYFDIYLMHAQERKLFEKFKACRAYETAFELKKQGKVNHVGLSFHDKAEILDRILTEYPEIEVVQIQFNYLDYEDPSVEGRKCYEICRKHNKPIIIMEPVKGGSLVNLPQEADKILRSFNSYSNAGFALRYCAQFDGVFMTLSGMGNMDMMKDNVSTFKEFKPLSQKETEALEEVRKIVIKQSLIQCTACKYCVAGCPKNISIPDIFASYNDYKTFSNWNAEYYYNLHTNKGGKASDCIECGLCEEICPQHLEIRKLLKKAARAFEA